MKLKLFFSLFAMLFVFATASASFPVKRTAKTTADTEITVEDAELSSPAAAAMAYNKWAALALWFFLGGLAAHRWYAGKPVGWNILFILTLGGLAIWWIVDLVNILSDNF